MAICRVYLCTYRRNHLLRRSLNSLLAQTVTDWICELHNDDPENSFPRQLIEEINDSRILIMDHAQNLGATRTFNFAFQNASEPFVSLLEDDNWWEPNFLEKVLGALKAFPDIKVAWSNMHVWQEKSDGAWFDTKKNIWPHDCSALPELIYWPKFYQIRGALHSNGAMLVRSEYAKQYIIPDNIKFGGTEAIRERAFHFPVLFIPQALANFSVTLETSRPQDFIDYRYKQVLLIASFVKHVPLTEKDLDKLWNEARSRSAKFTTTLFWAALNFSECRKLLKYAKTNDWIFFIAFSLKHPLSGFLVSKTINANKELYNFLDKNTALRVEEACKYGFDFSGLLP